MELFEFILLVKLMFKHPPKTTLLLDNRWIRQGLNSWLQNAESRIKIQLISIQEHKTCANTSIKVEKRMFMSENLL
jgi:hypothetical protein